MPSGPSARTDQPSQHDVPQREFIAALEAGQLTLFFQPIVRLGTGRIRGVEALVRWRLRDGTLLLPDDFLPAVAHTPVIHRLTAWVINQACAQAAQWQPWRVAVNITAADVVEPSLVGTVTDALNRHQLSADALTVELTEHAAVQGLAAATAVLDQLRDMGVGVALDDFGTGYSSLLYLRDLPVSEVKIDRTFVNGVEHRADDAAIVRSVIQLASAVGLTVVAEGVETLGQARYLQAAGCSCAQGYRYARPAPSSDVPHAIDPALFEPYPNGAPRRSRPRPPHRVIPAAARARIDELAAAGASLHTIAAALNRDGLTTAARTRWTAATIAHALQDSPVTTADASTVHQRSVS